MIPQRDPDGKIRSIYYSFFHPRPEPDMSHVRPFSVAEIEPSAVPYLQVVTDAIVHSGPATMILPPTRDEQMAAISATLRPMLSDPDFYPIASTLPMEQNDGNWDYYSLRKFIILHSLYDDPSLTYRKIGERWDITGGRISNILQKQVRMWSNPRRYGLLFKIDMHLMGRGVAVHTRDLDHLVNTDGSRWWYSPHYHEARLASFGEALRFIDQWLGQFQATLGIDIAHAAPTLLED